MNYMSLFCLFKPHSFWSKLIEILSLYKSRAEYILEIGIQNKSDVAELVYIYQRLPCLTLQICHAARP